MDDIGNLLYIAFLVIYVVSRLIGRKKKQAGEQPATRKPNKEEEETASRPTFEELLREFTEGAKPQKKKERRVGIPVEEEVFEDDYVSERYQEAVQSAKELKTIDEQVDLNEPIKGLVSFEAYDQEEDQSTTASDIYVQLTNPEDIKRAIVLKEILDTKF
jgi:hypothetical protein